jgi:hypothetical protein
MARPGGRDSGGGEPIPADIALHSSRDNHLAAMAAFAPHGAAFRTHAVLYSAGIPA